MNSVLGEGVDPVLKTMAKNEAQHLYGAMRIITGVELGGDDVMNSAAEKLREKFGRDMNGAIALSKLLKARADEAEVDQMLQPFVYSTMAMKEGDRAKRGGWTVPNAGRRAYPALWTNKFA
jgi:hypothetical protein